jgi:hypothetical protein
MTSGFPAGRAGRDAERERCGKVSRPTPSKVVQI